MIDIELVRRAIDPRPGFLLTRDQMENMQRLMGQLIEEHLQLWDSYRALEGVAEKLEEAGQGLMEVIRPNPSSKISAWEGACSSLWHTYPMVGEEKK